jgi:hypothetical protein
MESDRAVSVLAGFKIMQACWRQGISNKLLLDYSVIRDTIIPKSYTQYPRHEHYHCRHPNSNQLVSSLEVGLRNCRRPDFRVQLVEYFLYCSAPSLDESARWGGD